MQYKLEKQYFENFNVVIQVSSQLRRNFFIRF